MNKRLKALRKYIDDSSYYSTSGEPASNVRQQLEIAGSELTIAYNKIDLLEKQLAEAIEENKKLKKKKK